MRPDRRIVLLACAAAALLAAALSGTTLGAEPPDGSPGATPVVQSVPTTPRWFQGDDGAFHVEYELMLRTRFRCR